MLITTTILAVGFLNPAAILFSHAAYERIKLESDDHSIVRTSYRMEEIYRCDVYLYVWNRMVSIRTPCEGTHSGRARQYFHNSTRTNVCHRQIKYDTIEKSSEKSNRKKWKKIEKNRVEAI